ncbi:cytidylyltransferase domain-containing protein [Verrucomicrobiota bacterium]
MKELEEIRMILGVIPARGGSRGVQRKNVRLVNGRPLIQYAIECALSCDCLDNVVVSTDDEEIAEIARKVGADVPFIRPSDLARPETPMLPVLKHALIEAEKFYKKTFDAVVLLDPTGPLRIVDDVEGAIKLFKDKQCDAVVSGNSAHRNPYFNMVKKDESGLASLVCEPEKPVGRRQDAPVVYDLNTVVWVFSRAMILEGKRLPENAYLYEIDVSRAVDLDTERDFKFLEFLLGENGLSGEKK